MVTGKGTGKVDMLGTVGLLGCLACWSIGPIFIKYMTGYLDAWTQNALRYIVACLFWLPYLIYVQRQGRLPKSVWKLALGPVVANITMQTLWATGFYYLDPTFHNLLAKSVVFWVAIAAIIFFPEERALFRSWKFLAGAALSIAGVVGVIVSGEQFQLAGTGIGVVTVLCASMIWAVYTVLVKKSFKDIDSRVGFAVVSIYTSIGLTVLMFIMGEPSQCLHVPARVWVVVAVSGILAISLSHVMYYITIKRIGATVPALSLLASPFLVFAISRVLFKEQLTSGQWLWGVVLLAGSVLAIFAQGRIRREV